MRANSAKKNLKKRIPDTGNIKNELFSGKGISQQYGPWIAKDVTLDISGWGLRAGDKITLYTWSKAHAFQTQRKGQWVEESNKIEKVQ